MEIVSQGSMQADICSTDLDSLLENGHLNAGVVFLNSLSEELKVLNPTSGRKLLLLSSTS